MSFDSCVGSEVVGSRSTDFGQEWISIGRLSSLREVSQNECRPDVENEG